MCDAISYFPSKLALRISLNSPAFDVRRRSLPVNHNSQPQCSDWDRVSMCPLDYVHLQGWSGFLGKSRGQMSQHLFAALNFWCAVFWRMSSLTFLQVAIVEHGLCSWDYMTIVIVLHPTERGSSFQFTTRLYSVAEITRPKCPLQIQPPSSDPSRTWCPSSKANSFVLVKVEKKSR